MVFSSYPFIFLFLPLVWGGYFLLHTLSFHKAAKWFLVASSFVFYAIGSKRFALTFMLSVTVNYVIGTGISKIQSTENKGIKDRILSTGAFAIGILLNVGLLGYYKYADFFIRNFNRVFDTEYQLLHIILPIGISFFTFQLIAFLVDSWRGLTSSYNFLDYLLFITFFPQLIVGPIVHHGEMVPQFETAENYRINWNNVAKGSFIFTIGVAKKILLADPLTLNAQSFFDISHVPVVSAISAWWYSAEYTVSYYFDLSAYADMAIGIGLMFNIMIPENFNSPYKARNFQDYWQRWHMTLSRFLGSYIFRSVYRKGSRWRNYYVATMITFFVSGFWHGSGWHFVLWGLVNGVFVCSASWMKRKGFAFNVFVAHALTIAGIILTRIMFVCNFKQMATVFRSLVNFNSMDFSVGKGVSYTKLLQMACAIFIIFAMPTTKTLADRFRPSWGRLVPASLAAGISVAFMGMTTVFLYFQF
mgnify:CR=1 FL=1